MRLLCDEARSGVGPGSTCPLSCVRLGPLLPFPSACCCAPCAANGRKPCHQPTTALQCCSDGRAALATPWHRAACPSRCFPATTCRLSPAPCVRACKPGERWWAGCVALTLAALLQHCCRLSPTLCVRACKPGERWWAGCVAHTLAALLQHCCRLSPAPCVRACKPGERWWAGCVALTLAALLQHCCRLSPTLCIRACKPGERWWAGCVALTLAG